VPGEVPDARLVLEKSAAAKHEGVGFVEVFPEGPRVEVAEGVHVMGSGGARRVEGRNGSRHPPVG
jgi:hypothetical protein